MIALLIAAYLVFCAILVVFGPMFGDPYVSDYYGAVTAFDNGKAILLGTALAMIAAFYAQRREHGDFLLQIFVGGLLLRMIVAAAIFLFRGQEFFGGDALHYDFMGYAQLQTWAGDAFYQWRLETFMRGGRAAWGMHYLVAAVYAIVGRNLLAVQFVNSVLGAVTAVIIFQCAHLAFNNLRVARIAGLAVAFFPSLILWSAQGLKDSPIVFCLALAILATLKLGQKLSVKYLVVLISCLLMVFTLRFYVFYMMCLAVGGAFVIGMQSVTATSLLRQFAAVIVLGVALAYIGGSAATLQAERHLTFEQLQRSRSDLAESGESGFGRDLDVSTTGGAITVIPLGLVYLLFAPFPWQLASLRQGITLPEMLVWWVSFPFLILGLWFSIRHRLRQMSPILIFTFILTFAYSIMQGNVGTAYPQRAQLLVFYFIFVAVGVVLFKEKREEKQRVAEELKALNKAPRPRVLREQPQSARAMAEG